LAGPTYRAKRRALHAEMLRNLHSPRQEQVKNLTTGERHAAMAQVVYRHRHISSGVISPATVLTTTRRPSRSLAPSPDPQEDRR
jgi:hypothetical protein